MSPSNSLATLLLAAFASAAESVVADQSFQIRGGQSRGGPASSSLNGIEGLVLAERVPDA